MSAANLADTAVMPCLTNAQEIGITENHVAQVITCAVYLLTLYQQQLPLQRGQLLAQQLDHQ